MKEEEAVMEVQWQSNEDETIRETADRSFSSSSTGDANERSDGLFSSAGGFAAGPAFSFSSF
jgi:hypothetical protein